MFWLIDSCQNSVSADQYRLTVSRAQESTHWVRVFFWSYPLTSCCFSNDRRLKFNFFKMHMKEVVFMSRTFKILISNWPRMRTFNRLLHAGKAIAFDFSHRQALITLYVQFLCSDWSKFDRWVHVENLCSVWKLAYWLLKLTEFCVILWCFKLSFSTCCRKWNTAAIKIVL